MITRLTISMCVALMLSKAAIAQTEEASALDALDWFTGEWVGEGRQGDQEKLEGYARLYVTPVTERSFSTTFHWNMPWSDHVHYAFMVFHQTDAGVTGKGIHHGPDFKTFEEHPWELELSAQSAYHIAFRCVAHCRAKGVAFRLLKDGSLEERWSPLKEDDSDFIVTYQRQSDRL